MELLGRTLSPVELAGLVLAVLCGLAMIYYFLRWFQSTDRYSDEAEDDAAGCASALGFGCIGCSVPVVVVIALATVIAMSFT